MNKIRVYVFMLLCAVLLSFSFTGKVNAAKLSKAEKKHFSKCLKKFKNNNEGGMVNGARFFVYDVNGDGHKDVIAIGFLGTKNTGTSNIYMHVDGKYKVIYIRGAVSGVSSKGVNDYWEYKEGSGEKRDIVKTAYLIDKHGNITTANSYSVSKLFYDKSTGKIYKKGKILSKEYTDKDGNKISASTYKKTLNKTNKKKSINTYFVTNANIKKYLK